MCLRTQTRGRAVMGDQAGVRTGPIVENLPRCVGGATAEGCKEAKDHPSITKKGGQKL